VECKIKAFDGVQRPMETQLFDRSLPHIKKCVSSDFVCFTGKANMILELMEDLECE